MKTKALNHRKPLSLVKISTTTYQQNMTRPSIKLQKMHLWGIKIQPPDPLQITSYLCRYRVHLLLAKSWFHIKSRNRSSRNLTLFRLGFFGRPWTGGKGASNAPLHFLKTMEDINMKLSPIIKRRKIDLLLLSYLSCDFT